MPVSPSVPLPQRTACHGARPPQRCPGAPPAARAYKSGSPDRFVACFTKLSLAKLRGLPAAEALPDIQAQTRTARRLKAWCNFSPFVTNADAVLAVPAVQMWLPADAVSTCKQPRPACMRRRHGPFASRRQEPSQTCLGRPLHLSSRCAHAAAGPARPSELRRRPARP